MPIQSDSHINCLTFYPSGDSDPQPGPSGVKRLRDDSSSMMLSSGDEEEEEDSSSDEEEDKGFGNSKKARLALEKYEDLD